MPRSTGRRCLSLILRGTVFTFTAFTSIILAIVWQTIAAQGAAGRAFGSITNAFPIYPQLLMHVDKS